MGSVNGYTPEHNFEMLSDHDSAPAENGAYLKIQTLRHNCGGLVIVVWHLSPPLQELYESEGVPCSNCQNVFAFQMEQSEL